MSGGGLPTGTAENPDAVNGMGGGNAGQRDGSLTPTYYNTNPVGVNYEAIFNPNATRPVFDEESYLTQKAQQLQNTGYQGPYRGTTNAELRDYITNKAGMSLQDHYSRFGRNEGLNPYITGKTERVPVTFTQSTYTPQQQASYLTDLANQYSQRTRAATQAANQARINTANSQWANYFNNKAQAEAAATSKSAIDQAVQAAVNDAIGQQMATNNAQYTYIGNTGGAVPGGLRSIRSIK